MYYIASFQSPILFKQSLEEVFFIISFTSYFAEMAINSFPMHMIDAITALDADVISIETSRSHGELIHALEENTYDKGIGLGVYDIHRPHVPKLDELN